MEKDEELIISYKSGNQESFKVLIERHSFSVYNMAAQMIGKENAKDVSQEVFIKAWKNIRRFDSSKASFKTWLMKIARNSTIDFLRKRKVYSFSEISKDEMDFGETLKDEELLPPEVLQKLDDKNTLIDVLKKLNEDEREILVLYYEEEMTFDEIGKVLEKPMNTVKSMHRRAIIKLRNLVQ